MKHMTYYFAIIISLGIMMTACKRIPGTGSAKSDKDTLRNALTVDSALIAKEDHTDDIEITCTFIEHMLKYRRFERAEFRLKHFSERIRIILHYLYKQKYDDEYGLALWWFLDTDRPQTSDIQIINVKYVGNNWYRYGFALNGEHKSKEIKVQMKGNKVILEDIKTNIIIK